MKLSWILIVIFVFLMMLKETLNQQIRSQNTVKESSKRYHESEHDDYLAGVKQEKTEREKKNVPSETVKTKYVGRKSPSNLSLLNKTPAKTYIPPRKIVRIKPVHRNTKNIASTHKPFVVSVPNQETKKESIINQTSEVKVEEKDEIVDTITTDETISTNIVKNIEENTEKPLEEASNIKSDQPQIKEPKLESDLETKELKTIKINDKENDEVTLIKSSVKQDSEENNNVDKPIISLTTELDTLLENKRSEIKDEEVNQTDEKVEVEVLFENSKEENNKNEVTPPVDVIVKPRKHPFLDAIQNDLHICCPINYKPTDDEESRINNNVVALTPAFNLNSIYELPQKTENNEENEGLIIKNHNYEEIMEITRTPDDIKSFNLKTVQDNIAPTSYNYYNQVPYDNYQIPKVEFDLNNGYQYNKDLDEPRIDEIDGTTVVSYKNYYKMPTAYPNSNNNYLLNNKNYGYILPKPNQSVGSNFWNNNRVFNKPIQAYGDKERIWRSWKNTEYYLKSRNGLKQFSNENFYNFVKQNDRNNIYNRSKNAVDINGNYRKLNNLPYL